MKFDLRQSITPSRLLAFAVHILLIVWLIINLENFYARIGVDKIIAGWIAPDRQVAKMELPSESINWTISVLFFLFGGIVYYWGNRLVPHAMVFAQDVYWFFRPKAVRQKQMLEGMDKIRALIDEGALIRDNTSHDPMEERSEWYTRVCPVLTECYPQGLSGFQAQHTIHWNKGHREILDIEIMKLNGILVSMREKFE